jgi:hypothetical protein
MSASYAIIMRQGWEAKPTLRTTAPAASPHLLGCVINALLDLSRNCVAVYGALLAEATTPVARTALRVAALSSHRRSSLSP